MRKIASPIKLEETKGLYMPSANFNALFLTAHAMNHFLYESIKVRHVLDWALFIKTEHDNVDWTIFRPIVQIAGWNVPLSLMYTSDLSDSNV